MRLLLIITLAFATQGCTHFGMMVPWHRADLGKKPADARQDGRWAATHVKQQPMADPTPRKRTTPLTKREQRNLQNQGYRTDKDPFAKKTIYMIDKMESKTREGSR